MREPAHDPYVRCPEVCTHDLARGVLVAELLGDDGPHPDRQPLFDLSSPASEPPPLAVASA